MMRVATRAGAKAANGGYNEGSVPSDLPMDPNAERPNAERRRGSRRTARKVARRVGRGATAKASSTPSPGEQLGQLALDLARSLAGLLRDLFEAVRPRRWFALLSKKARLRANLALWSLILTSPLVILNLAVAFFGHSIVFPLSPFFLREKLSALGSYAAHQPWCVLRGHPEIDALVARAEARQRLPRGLLAAVVKVESDGRPHRISAAGAMGPGQLMPGTARMLGVGDPFDTAANVDGAARLLANHMNRFGKIRLAIAAYHAGPGVVRGRVPQNGQTPGYVDKVMRTRAALRALEKVARSLEAKRVAMQSLRSR